MAGIITNVGEDIKSLQQLRQEIENVKKALGSIDINVKIDIRKELEQKLQSLTKQYDTLVSKAAEADAKLMESAARIDKAVDTITKAQDKASKSTVGNADTSTAKAQVAAVEGQAKAYLDLKDEIDSVLGTREQNIRQMVQEQNAIRLINAEIAQINKSRQYGGGLTATQSQRLQQLNDSLLTHKQALAEVRQELNNNAKLDIAAVGSMNELSQSLSRMRIAYRALNEDERNSQFGQNLLKSIQEADARIKELDATIGNHQRNVGNYQGWFNGLNMSVQQIVRELPSATMGINMFFMAISNNLPIMADQIKMAKEFNKEMKAAGSEPVPVWKQLVTSIFSWQTAMMVGITLLTVYGKDIANWVKGMFNAKTAISDLVFVQQQLNAAQKEARKDAISEQTKLKTLYATTQGTTLAMKDRLTAVKQLKEQYPSYFSQLSNEAILAGNAAGAYRQLTADILKAAQARAYEKKIEELSTKNFEIEKEKKEFDDYVNKNKSRYKQHQEDYKRKGSKDYSQELIGGMTVGGSATRMGMGAGRSKEDVFLKEYAKNVYEQEKRNKEIEKNDKTIKTLTDRVVKINGIRYNLENQTHFNPQKGKAKADIFDSVKAANDIEAQKAALSQAQVELENQVEQARIDAMQEGSEKTLAAMKLAHKKELEQIDKQKEEYLKKKQDEAEAEFKADPKNKNKTFDRSTVTLSADEQAKFNKIHADTLTKQANEDKDYQRQQIDALNVYLKEYGTFEEKKLAITQEYEEKIRKAGSVGEKATLEMQRDKEIEKAKNDDLQNSIDWNGVFSDLQGHTKQYLQGLRNQLQELLNTGNLPIDQMQTISEKINAIDDELGKQQGIWDFVGERTREHNRLLKEAADAQERLNVAKAEETGANFKLNTIKTDIQKRLSDAGVDMNIGDISTASLNGKIDLTDEKFKGMATILQRLAVAEGKLTEARKKTTDATNKAKQAEDGAKEKPADAISRWFDDKLDFIRDKGIDQLPDLLGSVGLGKAGEKVGKGLDGFNSAAGAVADFASGNYIGAALKGISAIKSFGSALGIGAKGNAAEVNRTTERLTKSNERLQASIDKLKDTMDNQSGFSALESYGEARDKMREVIANSMGIVESKMSYTAAHHSNAAKWSMGEDRYGMINNLLTKNKNDYNDLATMFDVHSLQDLYKLTPEQMDDIRKNLYEVWEEITTTGDYDWSEYWEKYADLAGKYDELTDQIKENLMQVSFDSMHDDFVSKIMDMNATASDFADDFSQMMARAYTNAAVGDLMDDDLKKFREKWSDKMDAKDGQIDFTQDDIDELRKDYQELTDKAMNIRNAMQEATGYTGTDSQKATANGATEITYEQANNIVALTTAGNISREQIKDSITLTNAKIDDFKAVQVQTKNIADELRTIQANSYIELQGIHEDTTAMSKAIKSMSSDVSDIKRKIKNM